MSYILDALRRAEADRERERAQVPGLHAQPPAGGTAGRRPAQGPRRMGPVALGGAVVLLLLAGVGAGSWWASGGGGSPADRPVMPSAPTPQMAPPMPMPLHAPQPERRVEVSPPPSPPTAPVPMQPAPAWPATAGAAAVPAPSPALAPTPSPVVVAQPHAPQAAPSPMAAVQQAAAPAPAPIPRLAELPESLRRELPRLAISGSVYSEDPASRFVIANGEVLREGATLGPEHVLEQIGPRELVLRFKGQRYRQAL